MNTPISGSNATQIDLPVTAPALPSADLTSAFSGKLNPFSSSALGPLEKLGDYLQQLRQVVQEEAQAAGMPAKLQAAATSARQQLQNALDLMAQGHNLPQSVAASYTQQVYAKMKDAAKDLKQLATKDNVFGALHDSLLMTSRGFLAVSGPSVAADADGAKAQQLLRDHPALPHMPAAEISTSKSWQGEVGAQAGITGGAAASAGINGSHTTSSIVATDEDHGMLGFRLKTNSLGLFGRLKAKLTKSAQATMQVSVGGSRTRGPVAGGSDTQSMVKALNQIEADDQANAAARAYGKEPDRSALNVHKLAKGGNNRPILRALQRAPGTSEAYEKLIDIANSFVRGPNTAIWANQQDTSDNPGAQLYGSWDSKGVQVNISGGVGREGAERGANASAAVTGSTGSAHSIAGSRRTLPVRFDKLPHVLLPELGKNGDPALTAELIDQLNARHPDLMALSHVVSRDVHWNEHDSLEAIQNKFTRAAKDMGERIAKLQDHGSQLLQIDARQGLIHPEMIDEQAKESAQHLLQIMQLNLDPEQQESFVKIALDDPQRVVKDALSAVSIAQGLLTREFHEVQNQMMMREPLDRTKPLLLSDVGGQLAANDEQLNRRVLSMRQDDLVMNLPIYVEGDFPKDTLAVSVEVNGSLDGAMSAFLSNDRMPADMQAQLKGVDFSQFQNQLGGALGLGGDLSAQGTLKLEFAEHPNPSRSGTFITFEGTVTATGRASQSTPNVEGPSPSGERVDDRLVATAENILRPTEGSNNVFDVYAAAEQAKQEVGEQVADEMSSTFGLKVTSKASRTVGKSGKIVLHSQPGGTFQVFQTSFSTVTSQTKSVGFKATLPTTAIVGFDVTLGGSSTLSEAATIPTDLYLQSDPTSHLMNVPFLQRALKAEENAKTAPSPEAQKIHGFFVDRFFSNDALLDGLEQMHGVASTDLTTGYAQNSALRKAGAFGFLAGSRIVDQQVSQIKQNFSEFTDFDSHLAAARNATKDMSAGARHDYFRSGAGQPLWNLYKQNISIFDDANQMVKYANRQQVELAATNGIKLTPWSAKVAPAQGADKAYDQKALNVQSTPSISVDTIDAPNKPRIHPGQMPLRPEYFDQRGSSPTKTLAPGR